MISVFQISRKCKKTLRTTKWSRTIALAILFAWMAVDCHAQAAPGEIVAADSTVFETLARTRKYVQEYFDKFSDVTCKEAVTQLVVNNSGHTIYRENSAYDYQFQTTSASGNLKFSEIRETRSPAYRDPARTLLVTTGFANLLLVAHPMYELSYTFEPAGMETLDGVSYAKLHFSPVAGSSSPATLRLRGKNYPLPMSGTLWVDPQSGAVVKLEAIVDNSLSDLGLAGMRSEVRYAPHAFRDPAETIWVAESAVIEVQTPRQHWRNQHRFSDYKRFNVNIKEEMGKLP